MRLGKKWVHVFFIQESSNLNFDGLLIFICRVIVTLTASVYDGMVYFFVKKLLLYKTITSTVN